MTAPSYLIAIHEAGHAVIGIRRGMRLVFITREGRRDDPNPHCRWVPHLGPIDILDMMLAGELAGDRHHAEFGGETPGEMGLQPDRDDINGLLAEIEPDVERRRALREGRVAAVRTEIRADAVWNAIEEVAASYMRRELTTGDIITAIVAKWASERPTDDGAGQR